MRTTESDLAYTDPTLAGREHGLLSQDAVQLQRGAFRARCTIAHIGPLRIAFHASEARVRTRTATRHGRLAIVLFGPRARGTVEGLAVRPDLFLAAGPGAEAGFVAEPGWETVTFLIDPASLRSQAAAGPQARVLRMPAGLEIRRGDGAAIRHLFESGRRCAEAVAGDSPSPGQPETVSDAATLAGAVDAIAGLLVDSPLYRPSRREFGAMRRDAAQRHRQERRGVRARESRRADPPLRPVPRDGGERAHARIRVPGDHGALARGVPHHAEAAPGAGLAAAPAGQPADHRGHGC
jgi:hypothetical protein